ncbi:MAG: hypothetical protein IPL59_07760 [Candidatus Competibacteraceae bacterium]|nr:hypothetical protein [Candidatus Competibacteraceae bacterium]
MTNTRFNHLRGVRAWLAGLGLLGLSACGAMQPPPTAQSIAGLTPAGAVTLTETVAAGMTGGTGSLTFQGRTYPFKVVGTVVGPGGASRVQASGEVYRLNRLSDFAGPYSEGTGQAGFATSGKAELWMQNQAGVIMHLTGVSEGVVLSLGRDEVLVELAN